MLRDRYDPVDLLTHIPGHSLQLEPVLAHLDRLLDEDALFARVRQDLARRYPRTETHGRPSTPVEVILRMLVVMRLYAWSFAQTEYFVADSLILRQFCRVYWESVPDDTTLIRWSKLIGPAGLRQLHERVVALARQRKITRGRKLRVDTTVVQAPIHYPTDSSLLLDGVRGVGRWLRRARPVLEALEALEAQGHAPVERARDAFRDRTRSARRTAQRILQISRRRGQAADDRRSDLQGAYRGLLQTARRSLAQARQLVATLRDRVPESAAQGTGGPEAVPAAGAGSSDERPVRQARRLINRMTTWLPGLERAIDQATRRVLQGEVVPATEKLVSLSAPKTQVIKRGKAGREVEFGRKLWLSEVEGGIVSGYEVLAEASNDAAHLLDHLEQHRERFGKPPQLLAGDRGLYSADNVRKAEAAGVKHVVLPATGKPSQAQRAKQQQPWFRRGCRFRAGIEGRISVLDRRFQLSQCRYHGDTGTERWVGWGIVTHNLWQIARAEAAKQPLKRAQSR